MIKDFDIDEEIISDVVLRNLLVGVTYINKILEYGSMADDTDTNCKNSSLPDKDMEAASRK